MKSIVFLLIITLVFSDEQTRAERYRPDVGTLEEIVSADQKGESVGDITPNNFPGSDSERIQAAIDSAKGTTDKIVIPKRNSNGTNLWKIDHAILLPGNMTVILDDCIIQLSDKSRDNMFRSENVGIGTTDPTWNSNISIIGLGNVILKGADNPRATGDAYRTLVLTPQKGRVSYGSDAGKKGVKETGDWRNIMILIAYVDGFKLKNVNIQNSHAWAVSFERARNAYLSDITFDNPEEIIVDGKAVKASNKDGINLRHGCKYFRIENITGINGDDLVALSSLDPAPYYHSNGDINSYQVTSTRWNGPEDDTEQIFITNCKTNYTGVAIRASGNAGISHVYINGVITKARPDTPPPYGGSPYTLLVGGKGYGEPSMPGKINNIYAMNLIGDGKCLISVEAPAANCVFMNGIYTGSGDNVVSYNIDKEEIMNLTVVNLTKVR